MREITENTFSPVAKCVSEQVGHFSSHFCDVELKTICAPINLR